MPNPCGQPICRAFRLTVGEFELLGGERWTQGFRVRLGLLARKLHVELYGKPPNRVRTQIRPGWQGRAARSWRNKVCKYPCGILEEACRQLKAQSQLAITDKPITPTLPSALGHDHQ